ncbi:uncharacterized protein LOC106664174 [Cimex lectularius]|uniref:RNase H type-1 domain-containing protein n=1 Tax=Cimex lectularius TaxID=79782 RepID=A0A8I6RHH3_CIMLE|nr:uncharacterized protein LOC106664174 [Cimex lectularius]
MVVVWIPGYVGLEGNARADEAAKTGTPILQTGPSIRPSDAKHLLFKHKKTVCFVEIETKPSPRADLSYKISGTTPCLSEPPSDVSSQNDPQSSTTLQSEKSPQILYSSSPEPKKDADMTVEQVGNELRCRAQDNCLI